MKLTLTSLLFIAFANAAAFAGNPVINGCETRKQDGGNYFVSVVPGCITNADGSKGTGGKSYSTERDEAPEAPAEK